MELAGNQDDTNLATPRTHLLLRDFGARLEVCTRTCNGQQRGSPRVGSAVAGSVAGQVGAPQGAVLAQRLREVLTVHRYAGEEAHPPGRCCRLGLVMARRP